MSDLQEKFNSLQTQLGLQHGEVLAAIMAIGDLSSNLAAMNLTLLAIQEQDAAFYSAALPTLGLISSNLEIMLQNNSANTQRLLAMILATACPCDDITPLPPPLLPDPTSAADIEKCARIQFFIDLYFVWVVDLGTYLSSGGISNTHINTLLVNLLAAESITTGELSSGIPQYVRDSIMHLIANVDTTILALSHDLINTSDNDIKSILISALYSADNAVEGKEAFNTAIDGLELPEQIQEILKTMFYSAWSNDIYSDVPIVDTSEFDGTICAGASCDTLYSENYSGSDLNITSDAFSGWEEYRIRLTTTGGSALLHVFIDGIEEHTWAAPHDETFTTAGEVYIQLTSSAPASGTLLWEGCPSRWGGS